MPAFERLCGIAGGMVEVYRKLTVHIPGSATPEQADRVVKQAKDRAVERLADDLADRAMRDIEKAFRIENSLQ